MRRGRASLKDELCSRLDATLEAAGLISRLHSLPIPSERHIPAMVVGHSQASGYDKHREAVSSPRTAARLEEGAGAAASMSNLGAIDRDAVALWRIALAIPEL